MSFTRNILTLSIMAAFSINSPSLQAKEIKPYSTIVSFDEEYEDYGDEPDDSMEDFYGDEDFVSIATGNKQLISKAPSVASVYTAERIKNMGATDIDEVLETVPGLHIARFSNSYLPIYTFRGVHSKYNPQVLMLVNGIPITNSFLGNRNQNWGGMPVEAIARIEVIRGPGSAIYGADAFSGVINIITKNTDDIKNNEIAVRAGSLSTQDAWLSMAGSQGDLKYSAIFEYHKTDGSEKIVEVDSQTRWDNIFGTTASLAPGALSFGTENTDFRGEINYLNWTIRAGLQRRNNLGLGAGLAEALDPLANQASDRRNFDINYKSQLNNDWLLEMQAAYFSTSQEIKNQYTIFPQGAFGGAYPNGFIGNPEVWERHTRFNIAGLYTGFESHILRLGSGYHKGDMYKTKETKNFGLGPDGMPIDPSGPLVDVSDSPYIFLKERDRINTYAFVQDVWNFSNDWELTAGLRYDDYSDFGSTTNPRLALVWSTTLNLSTKLLYGKAFRAPSFADTGNINNPVALGNPDLKPERMETIELAFDYHPQPGFGVVASFYDYKWSDIIQFVPDEGLPSSTAQNYGEQVGYGAEIEVNWLIHKSLNLISNYSWSKATNNDTNQDVSFVPGSQLFVQLDWKIQDNLTANFKSNFVMGRERENADLRASIDDYILTDASIRWDINNNGLELSLIAKNIFDEDAREPSFNNGVTINLPNDLPLPGRTTLVQLTYHFN